MHAWILSAKPGWARISSICQDRRLPRQRCHSPGACPGSRPLDRAGPHPDVVLVRRRSEPDLDGTFGPANCIGLDEFLDTVLPQDPGMHLLRDGRGGDAEMPHLLWLEAAGLSLGEARTFGHRLRLSNKCSNDMGVILSPDNPTPH